MERALTKRFEDERLRRIISKTNSVEDLRKICLDIYEAKIIQEQTLMQMLFKWEGLDQERVERLLPKPQWPGKQTS